MGVVQGDKDAFAAVLRMAGLIYDREQWSDGSAHLVQIGDVPPRGPHSRQSFDLRMRLEKEAAVAGGKVRFLIGNHDGGLVYGDLRNVHPEEYGEFRTASGRSL